MSDTYRVVVLDAGGREVGDVQVLRMQPADVLVIMPLPDQSLGRNYVESINETFQQLHITTVVFQHPVQLARLERVE